MPSKLPAPDIRVVDNKGPNNLLALLKTELGRAVRADFAVAFATDAGLDPLHQLLADLSRRGSVRFITGTYQAVTEPGALRALMELQRTSKRGLRAKLSTQPRFHWKLYLVWGPKGRATAVVGSSNLTSEGLTSMGETSIVIRGRAEHPIFRSLEKQFDSEWDLGGSLISDEQIDEYEKERGDGPPRPPKLSLRKISGKGDPEKARTPPGRFYRDAVTGRATKATERQISEATSWDEEGWNWFTADRCLYEDRDKLIYFDLVDDWVTAVEVMSSTRLPRSPDGRYAFAFRTLKGVPRRRLTRLLFSELRARQLLKTKHDAERRAHMKVGRWTTYLDLLRRGA